MPKDVSGLTFGNCGFYLEFKSTLSIGTLIAQDAGTPIGNMTSGGGLAAAFNGSIENYNAGAQSNSTSGNIGKDFGSGVTKTVTGVVVKTLGNVTVDGGASDETMTLTVERSDNGTDFTQIFTQSGQSIGNSHVFTRRLGFSNTAAARYARISISHSGGAETHIAELEFYENGSSLGSDLGTDSSGNSNHFTMNNGTGQQDADIWAITDQFTDAPSKNFCTWDQGRRAGNTLSEGNLKATSDGASDWDSVIGTMFVSSGKYYWEINRDSDPAGSDRFRTGVAQDSLPTLIVDDGKDVFGLSENGQIHGGGLALTNYGDSTTTGDYIGVALDMDRNAIYFSKNGTWMNSASASGIADGSDLAKAAHTNVIGSVTPFISTYDTQVATLRTASGRWEGTAPTGFLELNQDNLDATASKLTAWAWIKNRDADDNHMLLDRVRGVNKDLHSNSTAAEATNANTLQRFLQRGVQVGSDVEVNTVNESYVLWQWLLGNSATTGSTNSDGSVDTTVIAADAGHFSVVKGTTGSSGATFGHGLGAAPDLIINKNLTDGSSNWLVYNSISGATYYLALNLTNSKFGPGSTVFGTEPTSTVFTLGSFFNSVECINYCFRSIPGVCKVGSYEGNNNADGTYVSLGFTPAWVLTKNIDGTAAWGIMDNAREPNNAVVKRLFANANSAEDEDGEQMDFLSDGFKLRKTGGFNSAQTYIYLAMADIAGNGTLPPIYGR